MGKNFLNDLSINMKDMNENESVHKIDKTEQTSLNNMKRAVTFR